MDLGKVYIVTSGTGECQNSLKFECKLRAYSCCSKQALNVKSDIQESNWRAWERTYTAHCLYQWSERVLEWHENSLSSAALSTFEPRPAAYLHCLILRNQGPENNKRLLETYLGSLGTKKNVERFIFLQSVWQTGHCSFKKQQTECEDLPAYLHSTLGEWDPAWFFDVKASTFQLVFANRLPRFLFTMLEFALKVTRKSSPGIIRRCARP